MAYSKQNFQDGQILTAANLEKMENGIIAGQGAKNLLVNSDFRNPIDIDNLIGTVNANPCFTRWNFERASSSVTTQIIKIDNGIRVYKNGGVARFYQLIDYNLLNKTVSYAIGTSEGIFIGSCTVSEHSKFTQIGTHTGYISVYQSTAPIFSIYFNDSSEDAIDLYWAALYEGSYTIDTIPDYVPQPIRQEMLDCGVPLYPRNLLKNSDFIHPLNTNGFTSRGSGAGVLIDGWTSWIAATGGNIELTSSGIKLSPPSSENIGIYQNIENYELNKIHTIVVYINDRPYIKTFQMGNWGVGTAFGPISFFSIPSANVLLRINSTDSAVTIQKVALYEGAYTIDTLPPYISEGKHVEMLNCNVPLAPHNLLDNSDFRIKNNIINTKGLTDYSFDSGNVFDRWRLHWTGDGRVSIKDGYIELYRETYCTYLFQHPRDLQSMVGKTYTVAAKVRYNGRIGWIDSTQRVDCGPLAFNDWDIATCTFTVGSATSDIGEAGIEISSRSNLSFEVQWVALYEGAYTKETLPAYLTKGKHVEMLNCNVPLAPHNLLDNSDFRNPVNQRGATSYSTAGNEYTIDRWKTQYNTGLTIENGYINVIGGWQIYQVLKNPKDGVYTFAVEARINSIGDYRPNMDLGGKKETLFDANIGEWKIYTLQYDVSSITDENISFSISARGGNSSGSISVKWAAMYKGSYDASTLPAYQPKGYAAELAECMRYYRRFINSAPAMSTAATAIEVEMPLEPPMRVVPTITINSVGSAYTPEGTKSVSGSYSATNTVNKAGYVFYTPSIGIGLPCVITGIDGYLSADL